MRLSQFLSQIPCNLCGNHQVTEVSKQSRSGDPLRTVACMDCGLVWSDPRPHDARQFYEDDYRLAYKKTFEPLPKHVLRAGQVAIERAGRIAGLLPTSRDVLDVGCGGGEFAYLLKSLGHSVVGVEPNRGYAAYAKAEYDLNVLRGFIGEVYLPHASFDLITIWHVLEHTEDPGEVLRRLREALRPGGRVVVEVPNVEATCQSPRSSLHEAHLYTFSRLTLAGLAARQGLQVRAMTLSADGGNMTVVLARPLDPIAAPPDPRIAGHHAQVTKLIADHTPMSHALSLHPWRRATGRLVRAMSEAFTVRDGLTGRQRLDVLYKPVRAQGFSANVTLAPDSSRRAWLGWLAGAYVAAVVAEEILLDQVLPIGAGFDSHSRLAMYFGLQCVMAAGLLWAFKKRPKSIVGALKTGGWLVPLLLHR